MGVLAAVIAAFVIGYVSGAIFGFGAGPAWRAYKRRIIEKARFEEDLKKNQKY
jgi:hypothetical protein